jgi:tetratricopeptide (TPR) repeat protein
VISIGVAAHITAASPGGPRYDANLTPEQRSHPDNGIWLCQSCAKLIDNDPERYTVAVLREWKVSAEERALKEIERRHKAPKVAGRPFQAPRRLAEFVGRHDEIARLVSMLKPGGKAAITGVIGMGGVGKTELAKVVVEQVAERFKDGVLWADCGEQKLESVADLWAAAYGVQLAGDSLVQKAAGWRSIASSKEALLVFDNVQPGQDVEDLFPPSGCCAVLITTRHGNHPALHDAERLNLDQFTDAEAEALVDELLGQGMAEEQAQDAERSFQLTGYLPLALNVALRLAQRCGWTLAELNAELEKAGALEVLGKEKRLRKSLDATFDLAWKNLPDELQETFGTLAVFNEGPSFHTLAAAEVLEMEETEARARLNRLVGRSLLKQVGENRWGLHQLLREYVAKLDRVDDATWARFATHYERVLRAADDLYLQGGDEVLQGLALFDQEWLHIEVGQAWAVEHWTEDDAGARLCSAYPDAGAYVLPLRLHALEWIGWLETSVDAAQQLGDWHSQGNRLNNLGLAYTDLGEFQIAMNCHEKALVIWQEIGDWRGVGDTLGNLGTTYRNLGKVQMAIEYYQQALAIHQAIREVFRKGSSEWTTARRGEGQDLGNLGNAYSSLGRVQTAIKYYKQALAIHQEIGDQHNEGIWLGSLGTAYAELGEMQTAIEYYQRALAIAREIGDQRSESAWLGNLGAAYSELDEVQAAIEFHEKALTIAREIGDRRSEAIHSWNLGLLYEESDPARAVALMEVYVAFETEIGHPDAEEDAQRVAEIRARMEAGDRWDER